MRRKTIAILLLLSSTLCGYSQVSWTVKAGANLSEVNGIENAKLKPGYQLGVGMDYYFSTHWGIQPSVMLISRGCKADGYFSYPAEITPSAKSYDITLNRLYLELPIMLAYRFNISNSSKLVLSGGGFIAYGIGGKYKNTITLSDGSKDTSSENAFSNEQEKFDAGLGAGISYEYKRYFIGVFGEWGLIEPTIDSRNRTYGINIGYKF